MMGAVTPIVVLNGASSSGKSSLAAALVERLPGPVRAVSYDRPQTMVVGSPRAGLRLAATFASALQRDPRTALAFAGPAAALAAARALADEGVTPVLDVVITRPQTARMIEEILGPDRFVVGVRCSLEELLRRERSRPTRRGLAARQLPAVHAHLAYDVEVQSDRSSVEQCATDVITALERVRRRAR